VTLRRIGALLGAFLLTFGIVATVFADAANPDTVNVQVSGTTVTLTGTWSWFSRGTAVCAPHRSVGWAVDWKDPNDPGNPVGATGWNVGTALDNTVHTTGDCGTSNGSFPVGNWGPVSHVYTQAGDYTVCVLMYDLQTDRATGIIPATGDHSFTAGGPNRNTDNSAETNGLTPTGGQGGPCIAARFHISAIKVVKSANPSSLPAAGGNVTFTYTVTNSGQGPLSNIVISDDKCSPITFVGGDTNSDTKLDVTETWTYTCTKHITSTETNVVTVTGTDQNKDPVTDVTDHDTTTVPVAAATAGPTPFQSVLAETAAPVVTLPPTDGVAGPAPTSPNINVILMGLGLVIFLSSLLAAAGARVRSRSHR
jgi:uncharacterized repeat protein (TIGR01451 family)